MPTAHDFFQGYRRIAEDEMSRVLTGYEEGTSDEQDLYELLCWMQNNWESITGQA